MSLPALPAIHKRPIFEPQCTHITMTRLYDDNALCTSCNRPGPIGWLYQCTQDREESLERAVSHGDAIHLDDLGHFFTSKLTIRDRSPTARQDKLSFFDEISEEQMASYTPYQIARILRQRDNVHATIQNDKLRAQSVAMMKNDVQWTRKSPPECTYKVCQNCRPGAADRAFLSIDAIAKGEIAPTAAAGYGFHVLGGRPIVNAEILKQIGCRPVPLKYALSSTGSSSFRSDMSVMELLEDQIARSGYITPEDETLIDAPMPPASTSASIPGQLRHSPRCDNLATCVDPQALPWPTSN
ncbi:hypothetical protein B0I35DRAFT_104258 [Stachybotrys elegans]|uniref:Uncharacterized protein n=1 Tax=Stachybotrys elegans TaxID=80388 RepID=A0A8K0SLG9_9HYPO|nr:hypothetical protein B0I35DRAFT_104258 [Stachybotrys elegans]